MKRSQIKVKQYNMNIIKEIDDKFVISDSGRDISNFKNLFIQTIERVTHQSINESSNTYFILKFDPIRDDEVERKQLYKRIIENGIYINDVHYVKSVKSPSMQRTQKTLFIREDIAHKVFEQVTLGRVPEKTVVSKFESAVGIILSSVLMIDYVPNIVVINDFENSIFENVEVLVDNEIDPSELQFLNDEMDKDSAYNKALKENRPSEDYLRNLRLRSNSERDEIKSVNEWRYQDRRIKLEEISKPVRHNKFKDVIYGLYHIDQTEQMSKMRFNPSSVGKNLETKNNYEVRLTHFDGQSLGSFEFFDKCKEQLKMKYAPNAIQGRLPYFKSLIIRFDIKKWCHENKVTKIKDVFGHWHNVEDIDIIATKSCWKTFHDYSKPNKCLFNSMDDYYEQLHKYGFTQFGIANYAKAKHVMSEYSPITYQFLHSLNISYEQIRKLARPIEKTLINVIKGKDAAYIKAFLEMITSIDDDEQESEIDEFNDKVMQLISIDERLIFDKKVRKHLRKQVENKLDELLKGRVPVRGGYRYITNDPVAFMEHASGLEVNGFLPKAYSMFMKGTTKTHTLIRNPITSHKEVVTTEFIDTNNKWVQHLDNIIVCSIKDLALPSLSGADVDGDLCFHTSEPIILESVIPSLPLIHTDDKQTVDPVPYTQEHITQYELHNTYSLTGIVTNYNTRFQDIAFAFFGDVTKVELATSIGKILQMDILDSVKTGKHVNIPYAFERIGSGKKPYFMKNIYGGADYKYSMDKRSPFNRFVTHIEFWKAKIKSIKDQKIEPSYFQNVSNPKMLFQDWENQCSRKHLLNLIEQLKPLYTEYNKIKQKIDQEMQSFKDLPKYKQDPDVRKQIQSKYAALNKKYKELCEQIEPNKSVLATAVVEIAYSIYDSYSFAWDVAFEGMLENVITNQLEERHNIIKIPQLSNLRYFITGNTKVGNGKATFNTFEKDDTTYTIKGDVCHILKRVKGLFTTSIIPVEDVDVRPIVLKCNLPNGYYRVIQIMGKHYITFIAKKRLKPRRQSVPYCKDESTARELDSVKMEFVTLGKPAIDVVNIVKGNTYTIKTDPVKGYANIYDNDELECAFSTKMINKHEYSLLDFDGMKVTFVRIDSFKDKGKSFEATVNITY